MKDALSFLKRILKKHRTLIVFFFHALLLGGATGLIISFLSEGKPLGSSGIVATANSNYQLECDATNTTTTGTASSIACRGAPEWRSPPPFKIRSTINKEKLTGYLKIFFIDDLFPQSLCAEITTDYKPERISVRVSFGTGTNVLNSNTGPRVWEFEILNGKKICNGYNPGEPISINIDPPEADGEYLKAKFEDMLAQKSFGPIDDPDRFFEVNFKIEYTNWFFALAVIWTIAIYLAPKLLKFMYETRAKYIEYICEGIE